MLIISLTIFWIIAALVEGKRDGHFYNARMNSSIPDKKNIHWLFTVERFIIWSLIVLTLYLSHICLLHIGIFSFSLVLIFSFFHNGEYYYTRHKLDNKIYTKGWWDSSSTSEAFIELNLTARIFLTLTGFLGIITSLI